MDPPPQVEGCPGMKAERNPGWAPEPVAGGAGSSGSETFRRRFRRFCYGDVRGPREAFRALWELGCRWLAPEARSKEQILELLVVEQFLSVLPEAIRARAQQRCPESGEEAVALVLHLEEEAGRQRGPQVRARSPRARGGGGGGGGRCALREAPLWRDSGTHEGPPK